MNNIEDSKNDELRCPQCNRFSLSRYEVDIGVGTQYGPYFCINCEWAEKTDIIAFNNDNIIEKHKSEQVLIGGENLFYCDPTKSNPSQICNIVNIAQPILELTLKETKVLEEFFIKEYISYKKPEQHEVLRKIMRFNRENATAPSSSR